MSQLNPSGIRLVFFFVAAAALVSPDPGLGVGTRTELPISVLADLLSEDKTTRRRARERMATNWDIAYVPMILEMLMALPGYSSAAAIPSGQSPFVSAYQRSARVEQHEYALPQAAGRSIGSSHKQDQWTPT